MQLDAAWMKEAVHHLVDPAATLAGPGQRHTALMK
jgi:hypothetical protein